MIGWIVFGAWMLGALLSFRPAFRAALGEFVYQKPDWSDVVFGSFMAGILALFAWPLVGMYWVVVRAARGDAELASRVLGGESRIEKVARLEAEKDAQRMHIERLERELGIGADT